MDSCGEMWDKSFYFCNDSQAQNADEHFLLNLTNIFGTVLKKLLTLFLIIRGPYYWSRVLIVDYIWNQFHSVFQHLYCSSGTVSESSNNNLRSQYHAVLLRCSSGTILDHFPGQFWTIFLIIFWNAFRVVLEPSKAISTLYSHH